MNEQKDDIYNKADGFINDFKELYNNEGIEGRKNAAFLVYTAFKHGELEMELEKLRSRINELENILKI